MLQPARRKFRKEQKGRNTGIATRGNAVSFGDFGLKSTDRGRLTARQIEAFEKDEKEVNVPNGTAEAHFSFNLTNISSGEVTINSVTTSCGGTLTPV